MILKLIFMYLLYLNQDLPFRSSYSTKSSSAIRSTLGYSTISLPLLLSELYTHICLSSHTIKNNKPHTLHIDNHHLLSIRNNDVTVLNSSLDTYSYKKQHSNIIKIGIVSGSFDHISGIFYFCNIYTIYDMYNYC